MPRITNTNTSPPSGHTRKVARRLGLVTVCEYHTRGCRHIYDYAGRDPFRDIPELVAAHQRECVGVGRKSGLRQQPHACQPQASSDLPPHSPYPREHHMDANDNHHESADWSLPRFRWNDDEASLSCPSSPTVYAPSSSASTSRVASPSTALTPLPLKPMATTTPMDRPIYPLPQVGPFDDATLNTTGPWAYLPPPPDYVPNRARKSAYNSNQRHAHLEADPFCTRVLETQVWCIGCDSPIGLDKRPKMRWYPTLWNKHRGLCLGVQMLAMGLNPYGMEGREEALRRIQIRKIEVENVDGPRKAKKPKLAPEPALPAPAPALPAPAPPPPALPPRAQSITDVDEPSRPQACPLSRILC
uniref:Uncharacterized protein n=1 Tax=Mycena chlorophos TaxID=658473 RepID=A0ABQ0LJK4_MYCCL|nr:predicted protein [Mycena chlorophos]